MGCVVFRRIVESLLFVVIFYTDYIFKNSMLSPQLFISVLTDCQFSFHKHCNWIKHVMSGTQTPLMGTCSILPPVLVFSKLLKEVTDFFLKTFSKFKKETPFFRRHLWHLWRIRSYAPMELNLVKFNVSLLAIWNLYLWKKMKIFSIESLYVWVGTFEFSALLSPEFIVN